MFQYQIEDMRKAINKLVARPRPAESVLIKRAHAEHLGVAFRNSPPVNEKKNGIIRPGKVYGSVVWVQLGELFLALKGAVGVDNEDYEQSKERRGEKQEQLPAGGPAGEA